MKKIVFVHLFNDRSGSPKVLSQVIKHMAQRDIPFEILTSDHSNGFLSELPGLRRTIFYRRSENKILTLVLYIYSQAYLFLACLRYFKSDVLFYVNTMMPCGAALAAWVMRKSVIYHIHETSLKPALLKRFLRLVIKLTSSKIIFVSNYLQQAESFSEQSQYVVHNALELNTSQISMRKSGAKFNVLMLCSMKVYKGILEFFNIANALIDQQYVEFTLVLNAEPAEIETWLSGVEVPNNVRLFSRQTDVAGFYERADLLLNLSRPDQCIESFGLTIIEGMAHGLPVIVPPIGGPAEIVCHGREGFLIPCYQTLLITNAIELLISDPVLHARLAHNARIRALEFNLVNFEKNISQVIDI